MTCVPSDPRFRLLDHLVGWDAAPAVNPTNLVGFDEAEGVRLDGGQDGIGAGALDPFLQPPRLAPGCGPCDWLLVTPPAPASRVLALDGCSNTWRALWRGPVPVTFKNATAIAVDRYRVAIADAEAGRVWVMRLEGAQILAEIEVTAPRDVSFGPSGEVVVAVAAGQGLERFTFNGRPLGTWPADLPEARIARIAYDLEGRLWIATEAGPDRFALYAQETSCDFELTPRRAEDLAEAFARTAALRSSDQGFCLRRGRDDGTEGALCWSWFGRPVEADCIGDASGGGFARQGQVLTEALDSGIPRCRWHRLRIDADVPAGTRLSVSVATSEEPDPAAQGAPDPKWAAFDAGVPHDNDWQVVAAGESDVLITRPAGRYLFVRMRLEGDGSATPVVRRLHIDFPRTTSADQLPAVYREDLVAGDFTERFMALFDASLGSIDLAVSRFPALIRGAGARAEVLPWIAGFLSVSLDQTWDTATRQRILAAAPRLFRMRGTRAGLIQSIRLAFKLDADPAIIEHGLERNWGAVAGEGASGRSDARLGATRLFSRRQARLTLGASPLGTTRVLSYGDPAADAHAVGAFRFSVGLPAVAPAEGAASDAALEALTRLIEGQKPAHTLSSQRIGTTSGFRIDGRSRIGVDTLLGRPAPAALGTDQARLSSSAILGGQSPPGPVLGTTAQVTRPSRSTPQNSCSECTP